jgi:cob(I)alamin adenosyltransferase
MVLLNRIYTRGGDAGQTSLGDGSRVEKTHQRIATFGGVDELNSVLGLLRTTELPDSVEDWLDVIQNDLFDLGADLCVPEAAPDEGASAGSDAPAALRMTAAQTTRLEKWIDQINEGLEPLTSFVLPGGTPASAWLHLARTVCRRVEVSLWSLRETEYVNVHAMQYVNRLSDLLFVLAQHCNDRGRKSVLWKPGEHRGDA